MIDDDLPARHRRAWAEAYAEERARTAAARRRFAAFFIVILLTGLTFGLAAALLLAALADSPRAELAWAIITGIAK